jgi:AraC-like DNA-binding protein
VHEAIQLTLEEDAELARLVHVHRREPAEPTRHPVEGFFTLTVLTGREAIGELVPRAVCFRHARPDRTREHERIFGAPVHFGCPRDELVLDTAVLHRPQRHAEPRLLALLNRQLDGLLAERHDDDRFVDRLQRSMMDELPDREPTIATIAAKQRMSPRTLQRRLRDEGTNFAAVLSELRRDLALRYLRDPRIAIGEVGFLLGFQDVTAFHRAFKRWTGSTPASYQRSAAERADHPTLDRLDPSRS